MFDKTVRRFLSPKPLLFIFALATVLRVYHLSFKSISIDEAIGGFYAMEPLLRVVILTINDVHPPLFYLLHHFWIALFGMSEAALRSISVLFALLSVIGLCHLGALIFNRRAGLTAAFLLAISPWHIWISQNARSNSLLLFLIIVSIYSFSQLLETRRKKWFAVYACVTTIAIYTHYFAFMIWIAQNLYVIMSAYARRRIFHDWWRAQIAIHAFYLFWLPFMISQFITKTRPMYKDFSSSSKTCSISSILMHRRSNPGLPGSARRSSSSCCWRGFVVYIRRTVGKRRPSWVTDLRAPSFRIKFWARCCLLSR